MRPVKAFKAIELATDKTINLLCNTSCTSVIVAIEDTERPEVVGFGRIMISNDYNDINFINAPQEQRIRIPNNLTRQQIYYQIGELIGQARYLPQQVKEKNNIINLNQLFSELRKNNDVLTCGRIIDEKQMQCEMEVVLCA